MTHQRIIFFCHSSLYKHFCQTLYKVGKICKIKQVIDLLLTNVLCNKHEKLYIYIFGNLIMCGLKSDDHIGCNSSDCIVRKNIVSSLDIGVAFSKTFLLQLLIERFIASKSFTVAGSKPCY